MNAFSYAVLWMVLRGALSIPGNIAPVIYNANAGYSESQIKQANNGRISSTYSFVQHSERPVIASNPVIYKEVRATPVAYARARLLLPQTQANPLISGLNNGRTPSPRAEVNGASSDERLPPGYVPLVRKVTPPPGYQIFNQRPSFTL